MRYTKAEDQAIKKIYGKCLQVNLSDYLFAITKTRRSNDAIRLRANRLGVTRAPSDITDAHKYEMLRLHHAGMPRKEIAEIISVMIGRTVKVREVHNRIYHTKRANDFCGIITDKIGMAINDFLRRPIPGNE